VIATMETTDLEIILDDIDVEKVLDTYKINKDTMDTKMYTSISDLGKSAQSISFLDESRQSHVCGVSMIDYKKSSAINNFDKYNCYWCKNPFLTIPIGCPIQFYHNKITKTYNSNINNEKYIIKETVDNTFQPRDDNIVLETKTYYETDGLFCSFNCCYSWIHDNKHNSLYNLSETLLLKMYNEFTGTIDLVPLKAPHWRNLKEYGGTLSIDEFRRGFNKMEIKNHGTMKNIFPVYKTISHLYEKKIRF